MVEAEAANAKSEKIRPIAISDFKRINSQNAAALRLTRDPRLIQWLNRSFLAKIRRSETPLTGSSVLVAALSCPGGLISIGFSADVLPALVLAIEGDAGATPPIAPLVASRLLAPLFEMFGQAAEDEGDPNWQAIGVSAVRLLNLDAIKPPLIPLVTWNVTVNETLHTRVGLLSVDAACVLALQDILDFMPVPQRRFTQSWRVVTMLRIATRSWSAIALESLECGDILLCQESASIDAIEAQFFCGALAGVHKTGNVKISKKKVTLMGQMVEQDGRHDVDDESSAPPMSASVAELEVPVHFEIDSTALSLAQLASLQPGYVIELAIPVQQADIRLVACGQIIGRGKLVVIGDCLGVQIESLPGDN